MKNVFEFEKKKISLTSTGCPEAYETCIKIEESTTLENGIF